ncbi:hypothetical protein DICVIV_09637, partial [Dictyocaulus viviparus]
DSIYFSVHIPPIELSNSLFDPGLDIQLRWDEWTSCNGDVPAQRREGNVNIPPIELSNSLFDPGLDIQLRWDEWTSCNGDVPAQRREDWLCLDSIQYANLAAMMPIQRKSYSAHCYIVARPDFKVDEDAEDTALNVDQYSWVVKLGRLVRTEALRKTGVRLHSSIVASYLFRTKVLRGCGGITEGIRIAADEVWRKYFLASIGVRNKNGKHIEKDDNTYFSLRNPFQACLRYKKSGNKHELIVGTYMIQTRNCF